MYDYRYFVAEGGLVCYGTDPADWYRQGAVYVDRILKGAKPSDLPVQNPTTFELVINLKTTKALGLTIPESFLLQRGDRVKRREFIARQLSLALFMDAALDLGVKRVPGKPSRNGTVSQRAKSLA
jgi:hypothetical protein